MTVQRYLAVLGAETARPPPGLHSGAVVHHTESEDETACRTMLETAFDATKEQAEMKYPGKGCGFGFMRGPYCSYATKDGVHILFSGEVSEWPGIDAVEAAHDAFLSNVKPAEDDDAHWLLDFYRSFSNTDSTHDNEEILQKALECLSCIKGSFAFVIYDSVFHRLLAARDAEGVQPMYWGSTSDGKLMFGSAVEDLKPCDPTATMFPAGTLFASIRHTKAYNPGPEGWVIEGEDFPGDLLSFVKADEEHWKSVKAIPRITSKGCVSGAVYKVSSQPDMEHPVPK